MRRPIFVLALILVALVLEVVPWAVSALQVPAPATGPAVSAYSVEKSASIWSQGIPGAIVSLLAALAAAYYFFETRKLSRNIADRTTNFEAQKLLLEINKQFVEEPRLLAIYDDNPANKALLQADGELHNKVRALGYMNLNVFEIIFAELPDITLDAAWNAYFLDALDRCSVLAEELASERAIYHPKLLAAFDKWAADPDGKAKRLAARNARKRDAAR